MPVIPDANTISMEAYSVNKYVAGDPGVLRNADISQARALFPQPDSHTYVATPLTAEVGLRLVDTSAGDPRLGSTRRPAGSSILQPRVAAASR